MLRKLLLLVDLCSFLTTKKLYYCFLLWIICFNGYGQCFECAKNHGGWVEDSAGDIAVTNDGLVYSYGNGGFDPSTLMKYDFNCNLIWSKNFGNRYTFITNITTDEIGNIYIIIAKTSGVQDGGLYNVNGTMLYSGQTLYKLDSNGNPIWYKKLGGSPYGRDSNLFYKQNALYITGAFYETSINNEILLTTESTDVPGQYLAKFTTDGALVGAKAIGEANERYSASTMDDDGNFYLTKYYSYSVTKLERYNADLDLVWSNTISTNNLPNYDVYRPINLHYSESSDKLYVWGTATSTVSILGNIYNVSPPNSGITNSILTEFSPSTGSLERHKLIKNIDEAEYLNPFYNSGHFEEKDGELYIFTNFTNTLVFPNATIHSTSYTSGGHTFNAQDMVLFKVNLTTFEDEFIFRTFYGDNGWYRDDHADKIVFHDDDLYMTGSFVSTPLNINGSIINNNSGNGESDAMLYKYNLNASAGSGEIIVDNSCINELTSFHVEGAYSSISWNFGDPASASNTSTLDNPQHQFSGAGSYHVTAVVSCAGGSQTIEKDIVVTASPTAGVVAPIYECETVSGSGISSGFDTSGIHSALANGQSNIMVKYENSSGVPLPSPLPNPYTNTTIGGDVITAKVYFSNNPYCYDTTTIAFHTMPSPVPPVLNTAPVYCRQENKTLADIDITGVNIQWYDAVTGGNLLPDTTPLDYDFTYYASQNVGGCASERLAVAVTVYNTSHPIGFAVQYFCDTQVLTLADFVLTGTDVIFYDSQFGGNVLPITTPLVDDVAYWASQTLNGCESMSRLPLISDITSDLPAHDFAMNACDNLNDGKEKVDLSFYNEDIVPASHGYSFSYYTDFASADAEVAANEITDFIDYELLPGVNSVFVRVENTTMCYKVVELRLTLIPAPILQMKDTYGLCVGGSVTITADAGFHTYSWSDTSMGQSLTVTEPGTYSVRVTEFHGDVICGTTKTITVVASDKPTITSIETSDWTDYENMLTVIVSGGGTYEYSLDGGIYQLSNQFTGLANGEYTVHVRDINGCGVDHEDVYLLMYPKFFTPNGDSYNDAWGIKFYKNEPRMVVQIFDRQGKFIKQLTDTDPLWDGTHNGQLLPATDYWFTVLRENGKEHRGHFSLKR